MYDNEAEDAVIGSVLIGGLATYDEARETLSDTGIDFYQERLRVIWESFASLSRDDTPIDIFTVNNKINGRMGIDTAVLMALAGKGNYLKIKYYCEIVRDKSIVRQTIRIYDEQKQRLMSGEDPQEVLSQGLVIASAILESQKQQEAAHIKDIVQDVYDEIGNRYEEKQKFMGTPTGFAKLDTVTGGARGITLLAARPGVGKTTFALNVALNTAEENPVLIFSLEMDKEELGEKILACESGVDSVRLENAALIQDTDWPKLAHCMGKIYDKNIWIDDSEDMKASQIAIRAKRMKAMYGIKLIIIDYVQLIDPEKSTGNRNAEITETMRILKKLSRSLKIPILLLSQLSRDIEKRNDKTPNNADLRDSGSLEQDAHIVMFLYREDTEQGESKTNLLITKNRKGQNNVKFEPTFIASRSKFIL